MTRFPRLFGWTAIATSMLAGAAEAQPYYRDHMMGWWWGNGGGFPFGLLIIILVIAAIIALLWKLFSRPASKANDAAPQARSSTAALDILRERFARGEINKDEFEERRRVLES